MPGSSMHVQTSVDQWDVDEAMTGLHPSIMLESLSMYYRGLSNFDATPPASGGRPKKPKQQQEKGGQGGRAENARKMRGGRGGGK